MRLGIFLLVVFSLFFTTSSMAGDSDFADVVYSSSGHKGFLALPENKKDASGIILIHEWWGLNSDIRSQAQEYAKRGYVVLAVDLYGGVSTRDSAKARELATAVRKDQKAAFANLKDAIDYLNQHDAVKINNLASIGWCFGGGWSYQIARNNLGVKASVIYYGRFNPDDDLQQMRAKIMGHFAEKDRFILEDDVKKFSANLKTVSGDHKIFIYPNTHHGFANPENQIYDSDASMKAFQRTLEFLSTHL